MNISLNNRVQSVNSQTLSQLIEELSIETKGIAIGVNNRVVPRTQWSETKLEEGDKVVIVSAVFGG